MVRDRLTTLERRRITWLRKRLLIWFVHHARDFPWRSSDSSDYNKICVEVLLQRTRAEAVAKVYPDFFGQFRNWSDIAVVSIRDLEEVLTPLGLWRRRARSLKALAEYVAARHGVFPKDERELSTVPAVGQYVSNAIQLFQHHKRKPLLDANMARVLERLLRKRRLADIRYDPWLRLASHWLVSRDDPIRVNWAILDMAALVCRPRNPRCAECILVSLCNHARLYTPPPDRATAEMPMAIGRPGLK